MFFCCCWCSILLGTIYSLSSYTVILCDYFFVLPIPLVFFLMISIPGSCRPPDGLLYITPYLLFHTLFYIIVHYFLCHVLSTQRYPMPYVRIPHAVQIYGILVTCFDSNESSAGFNKCDWSYKSTMYLQCSTQTKLNSVALVRTRTIPTERPLPVGEVSANFCSTLQLKITYVGWSINYNSEIQSVKIK